MAEQEVEGQADLASVAGAAVWRRAFVVLFVLLLLVRIMIAAGLPLFGDEAFYWLESRHLAWGYSDLPGMTAWLVALGTSVGGHATFAVRSLFLLVGSVLPWLVVAFARRHFGARTGWQAGLLALGLPLAGSLGVLALPDAMLTVAIMLALLGLDGGLRDNHWRHWLLLALGLVLALASHYRAGMLLLAGLVLALGTPRGRSLWRRPRWYAALLLGSLGAMPAALYNLGHHWAGLDFQLVERNPWTFHADALRQPVEQALVCTPLLYLLLLWAFLHALRRVRQGGPWDLIACVAGTFLVAYFVFGLFADDQRFRVHWPLPGYLPLLAVVPLIATRLWRRQRHRLAAQIGLLLTWSTLAAGQALLLAALLVLCLPPASAPWLRQYNLAEPFDGWEQATAMAAKWMARPGHGNDVLVADNFRLAAELAFGLDDREAVYSLDSPLNAKHGRALQLAQWQLDEKALFALPAGQPVLLAVEETALRARQRPAWLGGLCGRFMQIRALGRIDISRNKRVAFYQAVLRDAPASQPEPRDACVVWRQAYAHYPAAPAD